MAHGAMIFNLSDRILHEKHYTFPGTPKIENNNKKINPRIIQPIKHTPEARNMLL